MSLRKLYQCVACERCHDTEEKRRCQVSAHAIAPGGCAPAIFVNGFCDVCAASLSEAETKAGTRWGHAELCNVCAAGYEAANAYGHTFDPARNARVIEAPGGRIVAVLTGQPHEYETIELADAMCAALNRRFARRLLAGNH